MAEPIPSEQPVIQKSSHQDSIAVDAALAELDAPDIITQPDPTPEPTLEPTPEPEPIKLPEADVTPDPVKKANETDEEFEKRIAGIQIKSSAHPNTKQAFEAMKTELKTQRAAAKEAEKNAKEFEAKFGELETQYKGKILTPEIEAELTELREQRRAFHIENDPEFQAKFSNKLREIDEKAIKILRDSQLPPQMEKFIRDNGGVVGMYNSTQQMPSGKYGDYTHQQFIENVLLSRLPDIQKSRLQTAIAAGIDLRDEMSKEIEHARTHGSELQKKKQEEIEQKFQQSAEATQKKLGKIAEKWEYPPNATDAQKKKVDKHNERRQKAEDAFKDFVTNGKNPERVAEALVLAAQSQYLMEANQDYEGELEAERKKTADLEEKIAKMKRSGQHGRQGSAPPPSPAAKPVEKMTDDEAFTSTFGKNAR